MKRGLILVATVSALVALTACNQSVDYQQGQNRNSSSVVNSSVTKVLKNIDNDNDIPVGRWKDVRTGCWYIIQSAQGGITPELQTNNIILCDGVSQ